MAASHYAYNALKMPAEWGVITVKADKKDAVFCVEQMFRAAAAATPENTDEPSSSAPRPARSRCLCVMTGATRSPSAPIFLPNRKARSLPSSGKTPTCSPGNRRTFPGSLGR